MSLENACVLRILTCISVLPKFQQDSLSQICHWIDDTPSWQAGLVDKENFFSTGGCWKKKKKTCNSSTFTLIFSEFKQANKQNFELQFLEFLKIDIFFFNIPSCFLVWVWVVFPSPETCLEGKSNGTASHLKSGKQICFWHFQFLKYFCSS